MAYNISLSIKQEEYLGSNLTGINGDSNRVLTLTNSALSSREKIYLDGLRLKLNIQYSISHLSNNSTATFLIPIWDDQVIAAEYFV